MDITLVKERLIVRGLRGETLASFTRAEHTWYLEVNSNAELCCDDLPDGFTIVAKFKD